MTEAAGQVARWSATWVSPANQRSWLRRVNDAEDRISHIESPPGTTGYFAQDALSLQGMYSVAGGRRGGAQCTRRPGNSDVWIPEQFVDEGERLRFLTHAGPKLLSQLHQFVCLLDCRTAGFFHTL